MRKEDKKVIKEIIKHRDLERNLPAYANSYMNAAYEYSLIHLVLNYYTIKEVQEDTGNITADAYLSKTMDTMHTLLFKALLTEELKADNHLIIEEIHTIRDEMTQKMKVLTAYTDTLQIYEYILNRVEYGITGEVIPVDESSFAEKVFQYLFEDDNSMVINSKIQMVTGQLPIRMTYSRFFDYLTNTLNIYNGSDKSSVDDFTAMLKSTALLEIPDGYNEDYPKIREVIGRLRNVDFKKLTLQEYEGLMEQFSAATQHLMELVSDYLLTMEIINDFYTVLLAMPYEKSERESVAVCISMLKGIHDAFISEIDIPKEVDEGFLYIEGVQELLGEDILQYESILYDVITEHKDTITWIMSDKIFSSLSLISKLLSNSLFIDLEEQENVPEPADAAYITAKRDELTVLLTDFFHTHRKEVNRAVMAALFSNMPVLFNSQQEIKDYIEYSLKHCRNQSELMACVQILEEMMEE